MDFNSTNPKKAYGVRKPSAQFIPPCAIIEESVVMALGASKYAPFNWQDSPVDATTYYSAALRHLFTWYAGEDIDPESGVSHLAHVRACCGILMDSLRSDILVDDRPKTSNVAELIAALSVKQAPKWDQAAEIAKEAVEKAAEVDTKRAQVINSTIDEMFAEPKLNPHPVIKDLYEFDGRRWSGDELRRWVISAGCNCPGCTAARLLMDGKVAA